MKMFSPANKTVILEPSISRLRGMIAVPEAYAENTSMCRVVELGDKVNPFIKKGAVVLCEKNFGERSNCKIDNTNYFMAYEHHIFGVLKNNIIYPLGRTVLIRRTMQEQEYNGIISKLENRMYQSLSGVVVRLGITRESFRVEGIKPGDQVVLESWQPHLIEVELEDGSYGLIVHETDLLYKVQ